MKKISLRLTLLVLAGLVFSTSVSAAKKFKWASVYVPEEGGISFVQITKDGSAVCHPVISSSGWYTGRMLSVSPDGTKIIYIGEKNKTKNVYIKSTTTGGSAVQRTFRAEVETAAFSPDGKQIVFCEYRDGGMMVNTTSAEGSNILHQIGEGRKPAYSPDGKKIYFSRNDSQSGGLFAARKGMRNMVVGRASRPSIWSYDIGSGLLTNFSTGDNAYPLEDSNSYVCERVNEKGYTELWLVNCDTGTESMIVSAPGKNFTIPSISPDGRWIVMVGNSSSNAKNLAATSGKMKVFNYVESQQNTDIYVVRTDGTHMMQVTYHKGNDCSPVWSPDGNYIYFLSQRGSQTGEYNIWKMEFSEQ